MLAVTVLVAYAVTATTAVGYGHRLQVHAPAINYMIDGTNIITHNTRVITSTSKVY